MGEADKRHEAYLEDRVRVNSSQSQIFGTQFYKDEKGNFVPRPIEDIDRLEERRRISGLEPFSEYERYIQENMKKFYEKENTRGRKLKE